MGPLGRGGPGPYSRKKVKKIAAPSAATDRKTLPASPAARYAWVAPFGAAPAPRKSMIDQRDSLAREVDEELRREQLLKLWEKYGTYVVAAAVLLMIAVGGVKYYQYRTTVASEAAGARLAAATGTAAQGADANTLFDEFSKTGPAGYA